MRKLNCHRLLRNLNSLCKFLDDTYDVNSGGCCFLASLIAKHLDKLNIKYNLVVYDCCTKNRLCIEQEVISCHKNKGFRNSITGRYSCNHYCLQLKGAGVINSDNYKSTAETIYKYYFDVDKDENGVANQAITVSELTGKINKIVFTLNPTEHFDDTTYWTETR